MNGTKERENSILTDENNAASASVGSEGNETSAKKSVTKYLAMGDSITTGYGLKEGERNYATLFAQSTGTALEANLAIDGQRASELFAALEKGNAVYEKAIKSADVITITIGGNDLMAAFYAIVAELMGNGFTADNVYSTLTDPINNLIPILNILIRLNSGDHAAEITGSAAFNSAVNSCVDNINKIAAKIKQINPDARILVANQYNPYRWLPGYRNIVNMFETGVAHYNAQLNKNASADYSIVDIYSVFNSSADTLTNADLSAFNLDFHPNAAGHAAIAAEMATTLNCNLFK